jgi:hypothetical protein
MWRGTPPILCHSWTTRKISSYGLVSVAIPIMNYTTGMQNSSLFLLVPFLQTFCFSKGLWPLLDILKWAPRNVILIGIPDHSWIFFSEHPILIELDAKNGLTSWPFLSKFWRTRINSWKGLSFESLIEASITTRENLYTCLSFFVCRLFFETSVVIVEGLRAGALLFCLFFGGLLVSGSMLSPCLVSVLPCIMSDRRVVIKGLGWLMCMVASSGGRASNTTAVFSLSRRCSSSQRLHSNSSSFLTQLLELYPKGAYVTYPYLESHESRLLSPIRLPRYLITTRTDMWFLHTIVLVA